LYSFHSLVATRSASTMRGVFADEAAEYGPTLDSLLGKVRD
jgi:hypothetical protein